MKDVVKCDVVMSKTTGMLKASRDNCDCVGYRLSRENAKEDFKQNACFASKAVYVLIGREDQGKLRVYVGDTSVAKDRFIDHCNPRTEKFPWQTALIFLNDRKKWNGDQTYDIQRIVLCRLRGRGFEARDNGQMPRFKTPEDEHPMLEETADFIDDFFVVLGFPELAKKPPEERLPCDSGIAEVYECTARGCNGRGVLVGRGFRVLQGSKCTTQESLLGDKTSSAKLLKKILSDGSEIDSRGCFRKPDGCEFSSPSAAAEVLSRAPQNGLDVWKLGGKKLGDIHPELRRARRDD